MLFEEVASNDRLGFKVGMCLPAGPYVTDKDVRYIVDCIKNSIDF